MPPLTATATLARRIDHTELAMVTSAAEVSRAAGADVQVWPIGGAAAVLAEPGSPFNKVIGLGLGSAVAEAEWDPIERGHDARDAAVQVELSTLADPAIAAGLTARGYRLVNFENVLACRLDAGSSPPPPVAITIATITPGEETAWIETVTTAFLHPDQFDGPASHESFDRGVLERTYQRMGALPGMVRMLARLEGSVAGGASLYVRDGIALLCGAATLPAHRRRGVQSALLHARLAHARAAGCDLAVVTTQPGSKSQQNVQRAGFELAYARAVLVREPSRIPVR